MFWLKTRYYSQKGKKSARRALYYRCYLHFFRHLDLMPLLMETASPEREWCRKTAAKPGRELTRLRANAGTHRFCDVGNYWTSSLASST